MSSSSRSSRSSSSRPCMWRGSSASAATAATTPTDSASEHASIRSLLKLSRQIGEDDNSSVASSTAINLGSKATRKGSPSPVDDASWLDTHACEALANCIKGSKAELTILAEMLDLTAADVLRKLKGGVGELVDVAKRVQEKVETA